MSLEKSSRSSSVHNQLLPKSVKVRSTCNACQQAKIRCSHEKPSCRRCQKHNIECIYSMSRRLGRPAKKKDPLLQEEQLDKNPESRRSPKKMKAPKKDQDTEDASFRLEGSTDETSIDDSLQTPLLSDIVDKTAFRDSMDFSPDPWFQDLVSGQSTDPIQDYNFFSPFESSFPSLSTGLKDPGVFLPLPPTDTCEISPPTVFPLDYSTTLHPTSTAATHNIPTDYITTPSTAASQPVFTTLPPSSYTKTALLDPVDTILPRETTAATTAAAAAQTDQDLNAPFPLPDPPFPTDDLAIPFDINTTPLETPTQPAPQCQCYETALRELLRAHICDSRSPSTSPSTQPSPSTIDAILTCQHNLQQLAETVLECNLCSRTKINLLMVIIISVDTLLSTLEASFTASTDPTMTAATTTTGGGGTTTLFDPYSDEDPPFPGFDSIPMSRRYKDYASSSTTTTTTTASGSPNLGATFKSQIESCPLLVGRFPIPLDEKCSFIKQLLHMRLSGLLTTVRRIRFCTQQILASSASRGRLIMMMETDRRLQVIIMRVKMLSR